MRRETVDLRNVEDRSFSPPFSMKASIMLTAFLCIAGIALSVIGIIEDSGTEETSDALDMRPYILLSSTVDRAYDRTNNTYEDLEVSMFLFLLLTEAIESNDNVTSELEMRLEFLYEGTESVLLSAAAEAIGEREICGSSGTGVPVVRTVYVPIKDGSLTVTISLWGYVA